MVCNICVCSLTQGQVGCIMVGFGLQVMLFMKGHSYWCHLPATPKHGNWYLLACDIRKVTWWIAFHVLLPDLCKRWKSYSSTERFWTSVYKYITTTQNVTFVHHLPVPTILLKIASSFGNWMSHLQMIKSCSMRTVQDSWKPISPVNKTLFILVIFRNRSL